MSSLYLMDYLINASPMGRSSTYYLETVFGFLAIYLSVFYIFGKNGLWARLKKAQRQARLVNQFPGLGNYPFLGSIPEMYHLAMSPCRDLNPWTNAMKKKHGPIFRFWLPGQPKIVITCTETAVKLLQDDSFRAKSSEVAKIAEIPFSEGLLALPPDVHGPRKKMWLQWMTRKHIDGSAGRFRQEAVKLCKEFEPFIESGEEFDIMDYAIHCTFRTVAYSGLGEEFMNKLPNSVGKQYVHDLHTFAYNSTVREFRPWLANNWLYLNVSPMGRQTRKCIVRANDITQRAVDERRLLRRNCIKRNKESLPCFLDHLLDLEGSGQLTEKQIIGELNVFIVAGYDTSGLCICYTLYLLSLYPEHQTKVVEELLELFGDNFNDIDEITAEDIKKMKYLELCIKESLRLYPILVWTFRRSTHDVVFPDGKIIPEDVDVYVALDQIHKDPKYFPEPEKFIPSRHETHVPGFMPFSLGSRNCIGQVYAMQEMKMILAHLLMTYKWETSEKAGFRPIMVPVLVPENGLHFKVKKRFQK